MSGRFPLSTLAGELRRRNSKPPATYRETYNAAVDGRIPAERGDNGRWSWTPADLLADRGGIFVGSLSTGPGHLCPPTRTAPRGKHQGGR